MTDGDRSVRVLTYFSSPARTRWLKKASRAFLAAATFFAAQSVVFASSVSQAEWDALTRKVLGNYEESKKASHRKVNLSPSPVQVSQPRTADVAQSISSFFRRFNPQLSQKTADQYSQYVCEASAHFGVDPALMGALIVRESGAKEKALSRSGAVGLTQVLWKVHKSTLPKAFSQIKTRKDLFEPENNIWAGTWIFSGYLKGAGGNEKAALLRYLGRNNTLYVQQVLAYRKEIAAGR
ncbi:transglycosylase SLT domain-containing protein [Jonquetella anthropi]|uniref:transglycosylase SLT domain-containing protein n=1 Tax=Jonquetella anthropi TaxID=428712 RepID=UPI0012DFACAB|nr:transglycosylase SLT domain-containing protein [Jonquetella anthropi]